ncbi:MAG: hypothetical protein WAX69_23700 [Victivallales bacterium]
MMNKMMKNNLLLPVMFLSVMCSCILAQAGFADKENLVNEEFSENTGNYDGKVEIKDGKAVFSAGRAGKYLGTSILFKKQLPIPNGKDKFLHLKIKVDGFSEKTGKEDFPCSLSIFFIPEPLPSLIDPYLNPDALWLFVQYSGKTTSISLYSKANQEKFGTLLYRTTADPGIFPLEMDLYFNTEAYRVSFDRPLKTDKGNVSGYHGLLPAIWKDNIKFGMRIVNNSDDGAVSQVILDKISINAAEKETK